MTKRMSYLAGTAAAALLALSATAGFHPNTHGEG